MNVQGLAPLSRNGLDVLGPITRTVRDAAIAYDVLSRFGTPEFKGRAPAGGYTSLLGKVTLEVCATCVTYGRVARQGA